MEIKQTCVAGTMESSDIMVTLEPGKNGIEIELKSNVKVQFGKEICRAITETLEEHEVKNAKVTAVDKGALDCTIRARVKTALCRAGVKTALDWKV